MSSEILAFPTSVPLPVAMIFVGMVWYGSKNSDHFVTKVASAWFSLRDGYFRCLGRRARQAPAEPDVEMAPLAEQLAAERLLADFRDFCRRRAQAATTEKRALARGSVRRQGQMPTRGWRATKGAKESVPPLLPSPPFVSSPPPFLISRLFLWRDVPHDSPGW